MGGGLHIKRHRRSIDFGKEAASKKRKTESLQRTHILTINRVSNNKDSIQKSTGREIVFLSYLDPLVSSDPFVYQLVEVAQLIFLNAFLNPFFYHYWKNRF